MNKQQDTILLGNEARDKIIAGLDQLANVVKVTLGPAGLNVILANGITPDVTKDGVSVARAVSLADEWQDHVATLIKHVSSRTEANAGDGTTTATVLAQALINTGIRTISEYNQRPVAVIRQLEEVIADVKAELAPLKRESSDKQSLIKVATVSADGDTVIAKHTAEAVHGVGQFGIINLKDGIGDEDTIDFSVGYTISRGISLASMRTTRNAFKCKTAAMVVIEGELELIEDADTVSRAIIHTAKELNETNFFLVCSQVSDDILNRIMMNVRQASIVLGAVRAPSAGKTQAQYMEDIAVVSGGKVVNLDLLKDDAAIAGVGRVQSLTSDEHNTSFEPYTNDIKDSVDQYVATLKRDYEHVRNGYERERLNERIARLTGGLATIYVGGYTEAEIHERKDRYDDAVKATQCALREGVVIGGGYALLSIVEGLKESYKESLVKTELLKCLATPYYQIRKNAEWSDTEIETSVSALLEDSTVIDVITGEDISVDEYDIVDPYLVTLTALDTSLSIAKLLLRTGAIVGKNHSKVYGSKY